jgi:hypothetical protein
MPDAWNIRYFSAAVRDFRVSNRGLTARPVQNSNIFDGSAVHSSAIESLALVVRYFFGQDAGDAARCALCTTSPGDSSLAIKSIVDTRFCSQL